MPVTYAAYGQKKPVAQPRRVKAKPAWSDYLTADNKFALSSEEILRRKQALLSRHNVFNSASRTYNDSRKELPVRQSNKGEISNTQKLLNARSKKGINNRTSTAHNDNFHTKAFPKDNQEDMTSLDLVSSRHKHWFVSILLS